MTIFYPIYRLIVAGAERNGPYIDGNANLMFLTRFMYEIINNKTQQEAFEIARALDGETAMYQLIYP